MSGGEIIGACILVVFFISIIYLIELQLLYRHIRLRHNVEWDGLGRPDLFDNSNAKVVFGFLYKLFSGKLNEIEGLAPMQGGRMLRIKILFVSSLALMVAIGFISLSFND